MNEHDPAYREFIFGGEDSVVRRWLRAGADGWRLDVADELPDDFVAGVHAAARAEKPDAVVIGEVWEDGSTKVAYGVRRKHILGRHCDGLMNYPFRGAALDYLRGGDAADFMETMETLRENYPPFAYYSAMNSLGTHDTPRILTLLGAGGECRERSREWRASFRMAAERGRGEARLRLGAPCCSAFPGSPTVYYGDEAGMEGFEDPFNRRTFPWGGGGRGPGLLVHRPGEGPEGAGLPSAGRVLLADVFRRPALLCPDAGGADGSGGGQRRRGAGGAGPPMGRESGAARRRRAAAPSSKRRNCYVFIKM